CPVAVVAHFVRAFLAAAEDRDIPRVQRALAVGRAERRRSGHDEQPFLLAEVVVVGTDACAGLELVERRAPDRRTQLVAEPPLARRVSLAVVSVLPDVLEEVHSCPRLKAE